MEQSKWAKVENSLREAGQRLETASNPEQFQAIGLLCRETLISLAQAVHKPELHPPLDGMEPSESDAKRKFDAYVAIELSGSSNEAPRRQLKATFDLANDLQHKRTANQRDAALCLEATRSAVNLIKIIANQSTNSLTTPLQVEFSYQGINRNHHRHDYQLEIIITNQGNQRVNDLKLDFTFPNIDALLFKRADLFPSAKQDVPLVILEPQDPTVSITQDGYSFVISYRSNDVLFPSDNIKLGNRIGLKYSFNTDVYINSTEIPPIRWTLYAQDFQPQNGEISLATLNNF
jgi:hypothetical protein